MSRILQVSQNARAAIADHPYCRRIQIKDTADFKTGPRGFALCRWCGEEVPNKRRLYCDEECVREFSIRSSPGTVRSLVYERDKGVCAICGFDTATAKALIFKHREFCDQFIKMGFPHPRHTWFECDHILPVIEGGGLCGLEGYRSLCIPCHRKETAQLAARRAKKSHRPVIRKFADEVDKDTVSLQKSLLTDSTNPRNKRKSNGP